MPALPTTRWPERPAERPWGFVEGETRPPRRFQKMRIFVMAITPSARVRGLT